MSAGQVNPNAWRNLVRGYLSVSIFRDCAGSLIGENASRVAMMQLADKNIERLLDALNGNFHRQRQGRIDEKRFDNDRRFRGAETRRWVEAAALGRG